MKRKSLFTYIGLLFIATALLLTAYNVYTDFYYGKKANEKVDELIKEIKTIKKEDEEIEDYKYSNLKSYQIDEDYYVGVIEIPDIELILPVAIDASEKSLNKAPGVYYGTPYDKNFVICAHNRVSFFSKIKNLDIDSVVYFMDLNGNIFEYKVVLGDIIPQENIEEMIKSDYDLSLFTCNYDESQRVTLRLIKTTEFYSDN